MKKRVRKILAFLICTFILVSSFIVFAAAAPVGKLGYLTDCELSYTMQAVKRDSGDVRIFTSSLDDIRSGDALISDMSSMTTQHKLSFESVGEVFLDYDELGYDVLSCDVTVTLSEEVPLPYFYLYSSSPADYLYYGSVSAFSSFLVTLRAPSGSVTTCNMLFDTGYGGWRIRTTDSLLSSWSDYSVVSFTFLMSSYPEFGDDRTKALAAFLGCSVPGYGSPSGSFQVWADNGAYRFYFSYQSDSIRQEGYKEGYNKGSADGIAKGEIVGFDKGFKQGEVSGKEKWFSEGYDKGQEAGEKIGYEVGYDDGSADGYSIGLEFGKEDGYYEGYQDGVAYASSADVSLELDQLFVSVVNAPVDMIVNTLDFDFLGFNLAMIFKALFTLCVCFAIFTVIMKVVL